MTFGTPVFAAVAAAIALPTLVILYFLKLRRKNVEVSTTLLWKKAIQDLQANAPFQKLRRNILLFLQLLVLAAALLALAQPRTEIQAGAGSLHVIMIDRSASMNAIDGDPAEPGLTRLAAAKRRAIETIESLRGKNAFDFDSGKSGGDQAMVIAFDASAAEIVERFTADKPALIAAVERIEPTDVPGSIAEAYRLAQAHRPRRTLNDDAGGTETPAPIDIEGQVAGKPQTFHLFTDGRLPDLDKFLPAAGDGVFYNKIGRDNAVNLAITGLRAERAYDRPEALTIFVGLQNASPADRTVDVELLLDGSPSALRAVRIPAAAADTAVQTDAAGDIARARARPGTSGVVFELTRPAGAVATVRLRNGDPAERAADPAADVLPTDDVGFLVIPPARQTAVAVVTAGNLFLSNALEGLPLAERRTLSPSEYTALNPQERDAFDVVVLDGLLPPHTPEGRALPEGRFLIFNAVPAGTDGLVDLGPAGQTRFIDWSRDHPVLRSLTLDGVQIASLRNIQPAPDAAALTLAETTRGPGIVELTTPDARAIVLPFDPAESNWPFNVSFVVFLAAAIDDLGSDAAARSAGAGSGHPAPGDVYADRLPQGARSVSVTPPGGEPQQLEPGPDGRLVFGPLRRTGVYEVRWTGRAGPADVQDGSEARRYFAATLLDAAESDAAPAPAAELADRILQASGGNTQATRDYWTYLLLAALAVLMLEWYIYNRKVYV